MYCQKEKGLIIYAWCLMSNHLQLICQNADEEKSLTDIIRDFKTFTSNQIIRHRLQLRAKGMVFFYLCLQNLSTPIMFQNKIYFSVFISSLFYIYSFATYGQCSNVSIFQVENFDLKKKTFCIEKTPMVELGDLRPTIYFECLSISKASNGNFEKITFLLAQTVPQLKKDTGDIQGEIYLVKEHKKRHLLIESEPFLKVKILAFQDHKFDLQENSNSIMIDTEKYAGLLIYSEGLMPKFVELKAKP